MSRNARNGKDIKYKKHAERIEKISRKGLLSVSKNCHSLFSLFLSCSYVRYIYGAYAGRLLTHLMFSLFLLFSLLI